LFNKKIFTVLLILTVILAASTTASADDGLSIYITADNQTIAEIADANNIDVDLMAAMNNTDATTVLAAGQAVYLPQYPETSITVAPGDSLWKIANEYDTDVSTLIAYNNITDPELIHVGDIIELPQTDYLDEPVVKTLSSRASAGANTNTDNIANISNNTDISFIWPLEGTITSPFGQRKSGFHHGIDIAVDSGTEFIAAASGLVSFAGWYSGIYGNTIIIDHNDSTKSLYGHASQILIKEGETVKAGQTIGKVGETGNATGPHLHFEIRIIDEAVDPQEYLH